MQIAEEMKFTKLLIESRCSTNKMNQMDWAFKNDMCWANVNYA